jgi:hypothetical protein
MSLDIGMGIVAYLRWIYIILPCKMGGIVAAVMNGENHEGFPKETMCITKLSLQMTCECKKSGHANTYIERVKSCWCPYRNIPYES